MTMSTHLPLKRLLSLAFLVTLTLFCFAARPPVPAADEIEYEACTSVLVGKGASADGSTMTSQSCDSNTDRTWINIVPRKKHSPGDVAKIYMDSKRTTGPEDPDRFEMGEIPQVAETYAYINTAYAVMNEYQLAIGETTFGGKRELKSDEGMLDCPELYRLALERAKTAREAIRIIGDLTKEYGYNDVGECFTFADPNETWHFEILGPGKGKVGSVWAAVRVPDDHVGVSANASRIRQIHPEDKDNYMASENVFSLAQEMGWWDPDSGEPFEFCYAYASRKSMGSRRREWRALSLIAPSLDLDPNGENFPFSVKAERKLTVQDVLNIFRNTYQDTPFDMTRSLTTLNREGEVIKSPVANPFMSRDYLSLFNVSYERTICCPRATYLQITQSRSWLPNEIGGVVWLGYDNPATTPHTPFYCSIAKMPDSYMVDGRKRFRRDCAWWAFRQVSKLATFRYQQMSQDIEKVWSEIEAEAFANQKKVEEEALNLFNQDPEKAKQFLTQYCLDTANHSVEAYWKLAEDLWSKYNNSF
jgi:dipeptidase